VLMVLPLLAIFDFMKILNPFGYDDNIAVER
jgi:hypothetical protein